MEVSSDACTGGDSQYYFCINFCFCLVLFYLCILVCFLPREISMEENLVNRLETNCRKSLIPFHSIWGLSWYNYIFIFVYV